MRQVIKFLSSARCTIILLIVIGLSVATGTIIEYIYGTSSAQALVFKATWFELLLLVSVVNLAFFIISEKLYKRGKLSLLLINMGIIFIIISAVVSYSAGFSGRIHLREGKDSDLVSSEKNYISVKAVSKNDSLTVEKNVLLSPFTKKFRANYQLDNKRLEITMKEYYPVSEEVIKTDTFKGSPMMQLIARSKEGFISYLFHDKETKEVEGVEFTFNNNEHRSGINIFTSGNNILIRSPYSFSEMIAPDQPGITFRPDSIYPLDTSKIYSLNNVPFIVKDYKLKGIRELRPVKNAYKNEGLEALKMNISFGSEVKESALCGRKWHIWDSSVAEFNGMKVTLNYGTKLSRLPFSLILDDFIINHYSGSKTPSLIESRVTLLDGRNNLRKPFIVLVNKPLKYKGYRFSYSSHDIDESGVTFSVKRNLSGSVIAWIGSILLLLGIIAGIFKRTGRFHLLTEHFKKSRDTAMFILLISLILFIPEFSSNVKGQDPFIDFGEKLTISKKHAKAFGELMILAKDGRIKPVGTISSEAIRKIHGRARYKGQNSDQVFLGMLTFSDYWKTVPIIRVTDKEIKKLVGITSDYAKYEDFLSPIKKYVLQDQVDQALKKEPSRRTKFDHEILETDKKVNICTDIFFGTILRLYPFPENKTSSVPFASMGKEVDFFTFLVHAYYDKLQESVETGNYSEVNKYLKSMYVFQRKNASGEIPSLLKIRLENILNKALIFKRLGLLYGLAGTGILILILLNILLPSLKVPVPVRILSWIILAGLLLHSMALILRWYISGFTPLTTVYEFMNFSSLVAIITGLILIKRSVIVSGASLLLASVTLYTAHLGWINPEIINPVPLFKSIGFALHSALTAIGYTLFGIAAVLALFSMMMMFLKRSKNIASTDILIKRLTAFIEKSLILGLSFVTISGILGALWINESRGPVWEWDPREAWLVITIVIYALVLIMKQKLNSLTEYTFNLVSIFGFASVIVAFFVVNLYMPGPYSLPGLSLVPVPWTIYLILSIIITLCILAFINENKMRKLVKINKK